MTFCKILAAVAGTTSLATAFSLYDTAPMVGVPESHSAKYFFSVNGGYDTNPRGSTDKNEKDSSAYVNASLSATFADMESVDKMSYNARLGGTHYLGTQKEGGRKYYGDCNLDASLSHAFSARSNYSGTVHVSYLPEPGYDNGFSSAGMQGDTLSWNFGNRYSEAIDARWSWNVGMNMSGTKYEESTYASDDRQYYSGMFGVNYRESDRTTYTVSATYRDELRSVGLDSQSIFGSAGMQYALDMVSTASVGLGAQCKLMDGRNRVNPTLDLGYRRRVTDGLSVKAFISYSDENVNNYNQSSGGSYRSCGSWRMGAYGTYVLSPDVSYSFRVQVMQTRYRKPTDPRTQTADRYSINPSLSMNYNFTPSWQGTLSARYSYYHYSRGGNVALYARLQYSAGVSYHF